MDLRNRNNVLVGAPDVKSSGGVLIGDVASTREAIPTDATATLPVKLNAKPAGYISPEGLSKTGDRSTEKIKDWNGDTIIVLTSEHSVTLKLTFMEAANANILKAIYGEENVKISENGQKIILTDNADDLPHNSYVFEIKGAKGSKIRVFAPDAQVSNVGDVTFVKNDVIKYEVELECFTDSQNNKCYQFIDRQDTDAITDDSEDAPAKTVTLPEEVSSGTWTLTVDGQTTEQIQHDATAKLVAEKLNKLSTVDTAKVAGTKGGPFTITGVKGEITADGKSLIGSESQDITVE